MKNKVLFFLFISIFFVNNLFSMDVNLFNSLKQLGIESYKLKEDVVKLEKDSKKIDQLNKVTKQYMQNLEGIEVLQKKIGEEIVTDIRAKNFESIDQFFNYLEMIKYTNCQVFIPVINDVVSEIQTNKDKIRNSNEYISKSSYLIKQIKNNSYIELENIVYLKVKKVLPEAGSMDNPIFGKVELEFDKAIKDFEAIKIYTKTKNGEKLAHGNAFIDNDKIVITLKKKLDYNTLYIVELKNVTGLKGEKLSFYSYNFTTIKRDIASDMDDANTVIEKSGNILNSVGTTLKAIVPIITTVLSIAAFFI